MNIVTVKEFNAQQEENWQRYVAECKANNVKPQPRDNFNQFITFDYKSGYVATGKYPRYSRLKRNLMIW